MHRLRSFDTFAKRKYRSNERTANILFLALPRVERLLHRDHPSSRLSADKSNSCRRTGGHSRRPGSPPPKPEKNPRWRSSISQHDHIHVYGILGGVNPTWATITRVRLNHIRANGKKKSRIAEKSGQRLRSAIKKNTKLPSNCITVTAPIGGNPSRPAFFLRFVFHPTTRHISVSVWRIRAIN